MSRTLEVFEHRKLFVGDGERDLRKHELDELVRFNDRNDGLYFEVGYRHLKARHFVGYVEVGDLSIEILPKADHGSTRGAQVWRDGLLDMLRVALGLRLEHLPDASQKLTRSRLLDLIAQAYLNELEPLLREGLAKGYRATQSNGVVFRGRLKMAEHLRENVARADRFFVEYQTFDHDIEINRVLAAALRLLSWCALSPRVACSVESMLSRLPELSQKEVTIDALDRIRLTRTTQRYAKALVYARMILSQQGPQLRAGADRVFALLFDMNALWERYIAVLLRRLAPHGVHVSTQESRAFWHPPGRVARRIRPDIVIRSAADSESRPLLVIDTKWKVPTNGIPSDEDLKQMFVYNELLGGPRSLLLYPTTTKSTPLGACFNGKPHACEQGYIGVLDAATWNRDGIKNQLAALLTALTTAPANGAGLPS